MTDTTLILSAMIAGFAVGGTIRIMRIIVPWRGR